MAPAVLAAVEATWASLLLGAVLHANAGGHRDVPFLVLALPGVAASLASSGSARLAAGRARALLLAGPLLLAWLAAAGGYAALVLHGSLLGVAHPWSLAGRAASTDDLALVLTGLAAARGVWLGWREPRLTATLVSVGLGALAFLVVLWVAATREGQRYPLEAARAGATLLLVACPGALVGVALVRERDLERASLQRPAGRSGGSFLLALGLPMAVVGGAALVVVFALAPLAPPAGHLLAAGARGIGGLLGALLRLLPRAPRLRLPAGHASAARQGLPAPRRSAPAGPGPVPAWLIAVGAALGLLALALLARLALALWRWLARLGTARRESEGSEEERSSTFSLAHLLRQLRQALARRPAGGGEGGQGTGPGAAEPPETETVRRQYRRLLGRARAAGLGRTAAETPLELADRLGGQAPGTAPALAPLTELYQAVRYGERPEAPAEALRARALVDRALEAFGPEPPEGPEPSEGPESLRPASGSTDPQTEAGTAR